MTALVAGVITLALTLLMSIAGVGAAFILIPIFLALGIEIHTAMATALLLNAVAMSTASYRFARRGLVVWKVAVPILIVAALLSPVGAWVSQGLDRRVLLWLFVGFLLFSAAMMLLYRPRARENGRSTGVLLGYGSAVGGFAGFVGGLLGVGGGTFIAPVLVALGFDPKKASGTTSFVVIFSSLSGFLAHVSLAGVDGPLLAWTVPASVVGATVGAWLMTSRLKSRHVKLVIGVVLLLVAAKMTWGLLA